MISYQEFLSQNVHFPPDGFEVENNALKFHGIDLMEVVRDYETPLRFTYLPLITQKVEAARGYFKTAFEKLGYEGTYTYFYCTKSSHFRHVLETVLAADAQIETSSAFDIPMIRALQEAGRLDEDIWIICNGFKDEPYLRNIVDLRHDGFHRIIPVLDHDSEFDFYDAQLEEPMRIGIRMATEESPGSEFYTNRLGMREDEIVAFYREKIANHPRITLSLLHFFVHNGIMDTPYYWSELRRFVNLYARLRKINPQLTMMDIGGGLPFRNSLAFDYDYASMIEEVVATIQQVCHEEGVPVPDLMTEFGSFSVAESSGTLFKILGEKRQNDRENWFMIDGSIISMLPDVWALSRRFMLLPLNNWDAPYQRVLIGGITCDSDDYYSQEAHVNAVFMPQSEKTQYIGFFHTGAYQEMLSGVRGLHHCLLPDPRHLIIDQDEDGHLIFNTLYDRQNSAQVLQILGY